MFTMKMATSNIINFDHWFDSLGRCIKKHLYEEMRILLSEKKIRPCIFDLLAIKLKKLVINLLPKRTFCHLLFGK